MPKRFWALTAVCSSATLWTTPRRSLVARLEGRAVPSVQGHLAESVAMGHPALDLS